MIYLICATDLLYNTGVAAVKCFAAGTAAAVAIVPTYPLFVEKSETQIGIHPSQRTRFFKAFKALRHNKAIQTIGGTVAFQKAAFGFSKEYCEMSDYQAALVAAFASAPLYTIFNGQSLHLSPSQSLRKMNPFQVGSVTLREWFFVLSLNLSKPIAEKMKVRFGDNVVTENVSYFGIGFVGSVLGHPFDTCLTRSQAKAEGKFIGNTYTNGALKSLTRKGLTTGLFNVFYQNTLFALFLLMQRRES